MYETEDTETDGTNRRRFMRVVGASAVIGGISLAGCSSSDQGDTAGGGDDSNDNGDGGQNTPTETGPGPGAIYDNGTLEQVNRFSTRQNDIGTALVGEVENISGGELSYIQIEVQFLNGDRQVATGLDNTNNLGAGQIWPFEASAMEMEMPEWNYVQWRFSTA